MTRLPPVEDSIVLTINDKGYTQAQAGELAFKCYLYTAKNLEAGFTTWRRLVWPTEMTEKDWLFLALYYISEIADDSARETYAEHLEFIREAIQ